MRYDEFKMAIRGELCENPAGFTWVELRERLALPYKQPCPTWVKRLESEIGLTRARGAGPAYDWRVRVD